MTIERRAKKWNPVFRATGATTRKSIASGDPYLSRAPTTELGRDGWRARFDRVRARTLELTAPLSAEDQALQSMPDASPVKWHLAHTSWFFETFVLGAHARAYENFDSGFGYLFNSYYEAEGPRHPRPARGMLSRPSLERVLDYRRRIDARMGELIAEADDDALAAIAPILELGLHHEQQHQELILMDVKHLFSLNPIPPSYGAFPPASVRAAHALEWISFEGGLMEIGCDGPHSASGSDFAFDNESPRHKIWLEPFRLASRLTTNAEYQAFIDDHGYQRAEFWLSDGWARVQEDRWGAPLYWRLDDDARRIFTLAGLQPIDPAAPVCHLSYYEADAFARWAGKRLPREGEWETAAASASTDGNLAETGHFHPRPAASEGLAQMIGDVWEWTQSPYTAYPRFKPGPGAIGEYNGKFMCNQLVLRGGSAATPTDHIRITYRNFFPPAARWAFSGVRLADDA